MSPDKIDLSVLPDEAKAEIVDFYEFLKNKYNAFSSGNQPKNSCFDIPRKVPVFTPLSREEANARK